MTNSKSNLSKPERERLKNFATDAFLNAARRLECVRRVKPKWDPDAYVTKFILDWGPDKDLHEMECFIEATIHHKVISILSNLDQAEA